MCGVHVNVSDAITASIKILGGVSFDKEKAVAAIVKTESAVTGTITAPLRLGRL